MRTSIIAAQATLLCLGACSDGRDQVEPVEVQRPDDVAADSATRPPGAGTGATIWVEDAEGKVAGILFRRGSDDNIADRAIYDIVTLFHPGSGLFYEVTMTDGVVRYPNNTLFKGYDCDIPIGVSSGACNDCAAGYGTGILHAGRWWQVRGGTTFQQLGPGSIRSSGLSTECVAHGSSNTKGFVVVEVTSPEKPPTSFSPPLRFVVR